MPLNDWLFWNNHPNKWLEDVHVQGEKEFYESKIHPKEGVVPDSSQTKKSDTKNDGKKSGIHKRKSTPVQQKSQQKKQGKQGKSSQKKQKKQKK